MSESSQMLRQKASELQTAVDEVQRELARVDASRRSDVHAQLARTVREACAWLGSHEQSAGAGDESAAAETRKAEGFLHEIRMRRTEL